MISFLKDFFQILLYTVRDVTPILILILFFQLVILKQPIPHLKRVVLGGVYVVLGLAFFLLGLEKALFPIGEIMATQLSDPFFRSRCWRRTGLEILLLDLYFCGPDRFFHYHCRTFPYCRCNESDRGIDRHDQPMGAKDYGGIGGCLCARSGYLSDRHGNTIAFIHYGRIHCGGHTVNFCTKTTYCPGL